MSTLGKITSLFTDKEMTIPAFPRTKVKAVSDDNGIGLDAILRDVVHAEESSVEAAIVPLNADTFQGYDVSLLKEKFINEMYPIGSVYMTSTNSNPSSILGGTWSLIDKKFAGKIDNTVANYVTLNTTNCSGITGNLYWSDHSISAFVTITPAVAITDSTLEMFTFNLTKLGISSIAFSRNYSSMSDGGQSVLTYQITAAGVLSTTDIIVRGSGTASLATGYSLNLLFELPINYTSMLDSACNKFYWKRTA